MLVIGYELSPGLISFLDDKKIDWIDFRISPIRFLQDLLIAIRSSIPSLHQGLASLAVEASEIRLEASRLMAAYRHSERYARMRGETVLRDHTVFVIGQTQGDASLVQNGQFISFETYGERLRLLLSGKRSAYVPHPVTTLEHVHDDYSFLRQLDEKMEFLNSPLYDMFCSEQSAEFVGLSSGALQEARFFRREATPLFKPICPILYPDLEPRSLLGSWQIPLATFTSPKFFRMVFGLEPKMERTPLDQVDRNQLRKLHDVWWGYAAISGRPNQETQFSQQNLEKRLSAVEKRVATSTSLLLDFPRTSDPLYAGLYKVSFDWHDGSTVRLKSDGIVLRDNQAVEFWATQTQNDPSVVYVVWEIDGRFDKVVRNPEWDNIICQTDTNSFFVDSNSKCNFP
jgi:hypothetical protein